MSGTVISTYTTTGLTLSTSSQNPVTITTSGEINSASTNAINGVNLAAPWTIENLGTLDSTWHTLFLGTTIATGVGISLAGSGTIVNGSSADHAADITGSGNGIVIASGSVDNFGTIRGDADYGLLILGASHVINGSDSDRNAYIGGNRGGFWGFSTGYLANYGTIIATGDQTAVNLGDGLNDTLVNGSEADRTALINGEFGGVVLETGTLTNFGTIQTNSSVAVSNYSAAMLGAGLIVNNGLLEGGAGVLVGAGGTLVNAGTIIGNSPTGRAVEFSSSLIDTQTSVLIVDHGAVFIGTVAGGGTVAMELAPGLGQGTIAGLGTQFIGIETITIDTSASWVMSGDSAGLAAGQVITGFNARDTLFLAGFEASSSIVSAGELTLSNGLSTETLNISADVANPQFQISIVPGATEITLCYLRGTNIRTPRGDIPVEKLAIGDEVITRFGGVRRIQWLGRQSYDRRFAAHNPAKLPVKIAAGALGAGLPRRDLFVSTGHSILLGGILVLARDLVNGATVTQDEAPERIDYIHIELETHDCVLAEGCWAESYADGPGLRAQCHNAAEFHALYPDYVTPAALQLCAPRPEHGPALEAALTQVVARATRMVVPGALRGFIDQIGADGVIEGWAQDEKHSELPMLLAVLYRGSVIGAVLASRYRADLAAAGLGSGRCSFVFQGPTGLEPRDVMLCRVSDGAVLALEAGLQARLAA
jgi:hypothetical protein